MNTLTAPRDAGQANGAGGLDVGQRFKATDSDGTAVLEIGAHEPGRGLLGAPPAQGFGSDFPPPPVDSDSIGAGGFRRWLF